MLKAAKQVGWGALALMLPFYSHAVSLGGGGNGPFAKVAKFFQDVVDFLGGTGTMFVVFLSFCGAICLWVMIPKQAGAAIAWCFRACVGGILLFGMGVLISYIKAF